MFVYGPPWVILSTIVTGLVLVYVVAAISGFIYAHIPILTIVTGNAADNWLHLVSGVTAMLVGFLSATATHRRRASYECFRRDFGIHFADQARINSKIDVAQ